MEHLSLPTVTIGSKDIAIGSEKLGDKLIMEAKQSSTYIDIQGHGDRELSFGSRKIGNKISVDFVRNADEKNTMKLSRAIGKPHQQVNRTRVKNCDIL